MSFISNIGAIVNNSQNKAPADQLIVVAKDDDNKVHNYFFACDNFWDARSCYAQIVLGFPKSNRDQVTYWTNYQDKLVYVYMGQDFAKQTVRNDIFYDIKQAHKPFFIGTVTNVEEETDQISVTVSNIGIRFKTKIPDEFRTQYINGQNVRDAFQAICELLGVYFICPPNVAPKDGAHDPDSEKNDPDGKAKSEQATAKQASKKAADKNNEGKTDENEQTNTEQENQSTASSAVQEGYYQVAFDSNGAITFNNTTIEKSFDSEEALLAITDDTYETFLEEGQEVLKDVNKFLNGEAFEELHPFYLDYNAITIQPKSTSSSTPTDTETPDPDTEKSMKKTKKNAGDLKTITDTKTAIQSRQLVNPISNTIATNVKSPVNIQKSIK